MWTLGDRLYAAVGRPQRGRIDERIPGWTDLFPISDAGPVGLELNGLVPHIVLLPLTIWLAVVVTKLVDVPSLKLSKWMFSTQKPKAKEMGAESEMAPMMAEYTDQLPR